MGLALQGLGRGWDRGSMSLGLGLGLGMGLFSGSGLVLGRLGTLSPRELVSCEWGTGRCTQPKRLLSTQADSLRREVSPMKRYLHSRCRIAQRRCAGPAPQ